MILTREMLIKNFDCEMLNKEMVVYKFKNLIDGKIYIGKTTRKLKVRIQEHISKGRNPKYHSYIDRVINKYGIENFEVSVVAECETKEELNEMEKFYISLFGCRFPNGYNFTSGGDGGDGARGRIVPEKTCKKISEVKTGCCLTKEQRQNISNAGKGKVFGENTLAKKSASCINKHVICCVETQEIFESIAAAAKWANISRNLISGVLYGRKKEAGGYHWKSLVKNEKSLHKRPILCVETGKIFESIRAAAKWAGVAACTITGVLRGRTKTTAGYHWQYADQQEEK